MKKTRFTAIAAASLLAACLTVPMVASVPACAAASANTVTITGEIGDSHTYTVYQIFTGEVVSGELQKITFAGSNFSDFLSALKSDSTLGSDFTSASSEAAVAHILSGYTNDNASKAKAFAKFVASHSDLVKTIDTTYDSSTKSISLTADGYYLIVDNGSTATGAATSSYLLAQYDASAGAEIEVKSAAPTVDKQVQDETADAEEGATSGWGETADHAINETFQFKLTATIPADTDLDDYSTYKVVFNDTLSTGVTFESIESVTVGNTTVSVKSDTNTNGYDATTPSNGNWTLTINDITKYLGENNKLSAGTTVTVIYNAHLNGNAIVSKASTDASGTDDTNNNTVYLEYSNNPNSTGTGTTTTDTVWVFTYGVDNTKYKDSVATGNELAGAKFELYKGDTKVSLIKDGNNYRPTIGDEEGVKMESASDGTFNIIGLDAGTYTLKETDTPTGYNTCADITITIGATHSETTDGTKAIMALTDSTANMSNNIVNVSGSTLPSTGGMGTKLFYIGGGCMVGLAGIFLITKKRMGKKDN